MTRRTRLITASGVLVLILGLIALTPASVVEPDTAPLASISDLDDWLKQQELTETYPLIAGTEKRIRWQSRGERTDIAIVYLHGFSATRQEIAPTIELVADELGANLFETRLAGHGREDGALVDVRAEDWLRDGIEALDIGSRIGERIVLVGTSTGATLAAALADHPSMANVSELVLISPNFGIRDPKSEVLLLPGGPMFADLLLGKMRSFETHSDAHARYWSSEYPTRAIVEAMRLLRHARGKLPLTLDARLLTILSPNDQVISVEAALDVHDDARVPARMLVEMFSSDDPNDHVLAGDILSPSNTESVAEMIVDFVSQSKTNLEDEQPR